MDNEAAQMRRQMDDTRAGLTDKLGELEHQVSGTVRTVKDSVNSVRDAFDLRLQVRRRPWTLLAGATALGFVGGIRSSKRGAGGAARNTRNDDTPPALVAAAEHPDSGADEGANGVDAVRLTPAAAPSWLANLGDKFEPEIAELKGILSRALLELVRDILTKQEPRNVERSVGEADDGSNGKSEILSRSRIAS